MFFTHKKRADKCVRAQRTRSFGAGCGAAAASPAAALQQMRPEETPADPPPPAADSPPLPQSFSPPLPSLLPPTQLSAGCDSKQLHLMFMGFILREKWFKSVPSTLTSTVLCKSFTLYNNHANKWRKKSSKVLHFRYSSNSLAHSDHGTLGLYNFMTFENI